MGSYFDGSRGEGGLFRCITVRRIFTKIIFSVSPKPGHEPKVVALAPRQWKSYTPCGSLCRNKRFTQYIVKITVSWLNNLQKWESLLWSQFLVSLWKHIKSKVAWIFALISVEISVVLNQWIKQKTDRFGHIKLVLLTTLGNILPIHVNR